MITNNTSFPSRSVIKRTINETWDENGKLISRETIEEYEPVKWPETTGPYWWQQPVVSNSDRWMRV
jgi:hypothetical protein